MPSASDAHLPDPDFSGENLRILQEGLRLGFLGAEILPRYARFTGERGNDPVGRALMAEGTCDPEQFRRIVSRLDRKILRCAACGAFPAVPNPEAPGPAPPAEARWRFPNSGGR